MPLEVARQRLAHALEGWLYNRIPAQGRLITELTYGWYKELKEFEAEETFDRAFTADRMTIRLLNADPSRSGNDYTRNVSSHKVEKQQDGSFKKTGVGTQVLLSGGLKGMTDRMTPENFKRSPAGSGGVAGPSMKNSLGLHDLSARLLDHNFPIDQQGFNFEKVKHAIFMPVPPPEDHELFYNLNLSAKDDLSHDHGFVEAVLFIRARLTRIKLAEATDMGSSMVVMEDLSGRTRIRYGYTGLVTGEKKIVTTEKTFAEQLQEKREKLNKVTAENKDERVEVALTAQQIQTRIQTAWRYQSMLKNLKKPGNNEIIIAYRESPSDTFPLITDWPDRGVQSSSFRVQSGLHAGKYLQDKGGRRYEIC